MKLPSFPSFNKKQELITNIEKQKRDENNELQKSRQGETIDQLAIAIGVTSQIASNAAPVLALTGVGIPLAAGLFMVGKVIQINAEISILSKLVQDCKFILGSKYQLYQIMLKSLVIYIEDVNDRKNKIGKELDDYYKGGEKNDEKERELKEKKKIVDDFYTFIMETPLGKKLLTKITTKLELLMGLLSQIEENPNDSTINKMSRSFNRLTTSGKFLKDITRELTVFSGLFSELYVKFTSLERRYKIKYEKLESKNILRKEDLLDIEDDISKGYDEYISADIDSLIKKTTEELRDNDLIDKVVEYKDKAKKVAEKYSNEHEKTQGGKRKKNKTKKKSKKSKRKTRRLI